MNTLRLTLSSLLLASLRAGTPARPADGEIIPSETCRGLWIVPISYGDGAQFDVTVEPRALVP